MKKLADGLWVFDGPFSYALLDIGVRMTVVRLDGDRLWVHSPIPLTAIDLGELGEVAVVVAPNLVHHLYAGDAIARFPEAKLFAPPGMREKRPDLRVDEILSDQTWEGIETKAIDGIDKWREHAFLHTPSRTLILTDHIFHYVEPRRFIDRAALQAAGIWGRPAFTRLLQARYPFDKKRLKVSIESLLEWDFDRLIMAHGDVIEAGGPDALRRAYDWLL